MLSLFLCPGAGQLLLGRRRLGLLLAVPAVLLSLGLLALFTSGLIRGVFAAAGLEQPPGLLALLWGVLRARPLAFAGGGLTLLALGAWSAADAWWHGPARS